MVTPARRGLEPRGAPPRDGLSQNADAPVNRSGLHGRPLIYSQTAVGAAASPVNLHARRDLLDLGFE